MLRLTLAFVLGLTIVPYANAQEIVEAKTYYTRAACMPFAVAADTVAQYNETILFTGNLLTFSAQGNDPAMGRLMFTTNQDTGTYSVIQLFADGTACLIGSGSAFEPYVD